MSDDGSDFGVVLALAYVTFMDQLDAALAAAGYRGFSRWFGYVLRAVGDEPASLRELAERLEMTSQGALKIVNAMVAEGYLERSADPADGRVRRIGLTVRGRQALAAARRFHADFEAELADQLGPDQTAAARAVLTAIVRRGASRVPRLFRPA